MLAEIRASEELKDIPIVVLSGAVDHRASLHVQELHVDGLIGNPVELDKFIGVVKSCRRSWLTELALSCIA